MTNLEKIEIARTLLINAAEMNFSQDILLRISRLLDKYHVEYLKEELAIKKCWRKSGASDPLKLMEGCCASY